MAATAYLNRSLYECLALTLSLGFHFATFVFCSDTTVNHSSGLAATAVFPVVADIFVLWLSVVFADS